MNRHPPFGNQVQETISRLPSYNLSVEQSSALQPSQSELTLQLSLINHLTLKERTMVGTNDHSLILLIGDQDNKVICKQKLRYNSALLVHNNMTLKLTYID